MSAWWMCAGFTTDCDFWQPVALSPADQGYHWNRNAKTYLHIGMAMGDAMSLLVKPRGPYRLRAIGGARGVTLNWQNGTEIPTSVQILRNGVEIAAAAPTAPPLSSTRPPRPASTTIELVFTMPVAPSAPLNVTFDGGITGLSAFRIPGGVYLTWENNLGYPAIEIRRDDVLIAPSHSGTATTYVDGSPPASGLVTYTVVPSTGTSTPATVADQPQRRTIRQRRDLRTLRLPGRRLEWKRRRRGRLDRHVVGELQQCAGHVRIPGLWFAAHLRKFGRHSRRPKYLRRHRAP